MTSSTPASFLRSCGPSTRESQALETGQRAVQKPGNILIEYVLDGQGRRVAKKVGNVGGTGVIQKRWLYKDGLNPIAELDAAGALVARFVYGSRPNVPDLVIRGTNSYRLISDQIGSPRYAVNIANINDVPYQVTWYPVGSPVVVGGGLPASSVSWIPFGFAGGMYDADTGLVHFGAREYDPEIGRWISKDPVRFDGGVNLYAYVGNDPVNRTDPEGKWYETACKLGVMAGCNRGCQRAATRTAKMMCSFMCSQAGQYMFCDWKEPGEPEPGDDGGTCSSPDPEPEPQPEPPCDPSNSSCE